MANFPIILFIVEGEKRDYRFIEEMCNCFFKGKYKANIINLPAKQNIYMLYQKLKADDFDTDIVELLRDESDEAKKILEGVNRQKISQVFLFFDYDVHQDNISKINNIDSYNLLNEMLNFFDNETEQGKLYLSYPMVEALYDYQENMCEAFSSCFIHINNSSDYKTISSLNNPRASYHFKIKEWEEILKIFPLKIKCLFNITKIDLEYYRKNITPLSIFDIQEEYKKEQERVFVLSAFPEFLFDYFKSNFWNSKTSLTKFKFNNCLK